MASFKVLRLLAVLVVMFTALAICSPALNLNERHRVRAIAVMNVPAPGPGPRAIKSTQNVSWWSNESNPKGIIIMHMLTLVNVGNV